MSDAYRDEYQLMADITTPFVLRVDPGAVCTVRMGPADLDDDIALSESGYVYADPAGLVHFDVSLSGQSDQPIALTLSWYSNDGESRARRLTVRPGAAVPAAVSERPDREAVPEGATSRPALAADEVTGLTDEELSRRGLPLRPDRRTAPGAYEIWENIVTSPGAVVSPALVPRLGGLRRQVEPLPQTPTDATIVPTGTTSSNWSGFVLEPVVVPPFPPVNFDLVQGVWRVPSVTVANGAWEMTEREGKPGHYPGSTTYSQDCASSMWVGLDGFGDTDLVQSGTDSAFRAHYTIWDNGVSTPRATLATYYAWTEFLPQQPVESVVTNFPVHAGDQLFVQTWVGDPYVNPGTSGYFGNFFLRNLTSGVETVVRTPRDGTMVGGKQAEWIMERPTFGTRLKSLSNYGSAQMDNAYARLGGNMVPYSGEPGLPGIPDRERVFQVRMVNASGTTLSTVAARTDDSMTFTWLAP